MINRVTIEINNFVMAMRLKAGAKAPATGVPKKHHEKHHHDDQHKKDGDKKDDKNKFRFKQSNNNLIIQNHDTN